MSQQTAPGTKDTEFPKPAPHFLIPASILPITLPYILSLSASDYSQFRKQETKTNMASNTRKVSLVVAASISTVEALKDQASLCRWNYALRSIQQRAKGQLGAFSQATRASSVVERRKCMEEKANKSEEALRTVMYLSCWGPN
ncbi:Wound-responsive family protein [Rhynchospora pubera]|uniref:Wound-responsive family protein n=1 Tax=Rhynchospora pubera TaxID=906938 RepID=A0AAV8CK05_9POAL|nr:Wound-responsive family protein [Rhynchospora pubera]